MTITELDEYFKSATLPKELVLHRSMKIVNVRKFVDSHLDVLKQNDGRPPFGAFYDRLLHVKNAIDGEPTQVE